MLLPSGRTYIAAERKRIDFAIAKTSIVRGTNIELGFVGGSKPPPYVCLGEGALVTRKFAKFPFQTRRFCGII